LESQTGTGGGGGGGGGFVVPPVPLSFLQATVIKHIIIKTASANFFKATILLFF
jgi:hypothetical protein